MKFKKNKFIFRLVFIFFLFNQFLISQNIIDDAVATFIKKEFENTFRDLSRVIGNKVANISPLANSVNYFSSFSLFNSSFGFNIGSIVALPIDNSEKILNAFTDEQKATPFLPFAEFSLPVVTPQAIVRLKIKPASANSFFRHPLYVSVSASMANLANLNESLADLYVRTFITLSNFSSLSYDFNSFGFNLAYPLLQKREDFLIMSSLSLSFAQGRYGIIGEGINRRLGIDVDTTFPHPSPPPSNFILNIRLDDAILSYNLENYFQHVTASLNFNVEARFNKALIGLLGASFIFGNHVVYTTYNADIEVTGSRNVTVELAETFYLPAFKFTPVINGGLRFFFIDVHFSLAIPDAYLFRISFSF